MAGFADNQPNFRPMTELNTPALFLQGIATFWYMIPLAILWFIVDTSWFKGKLGEFLVARSFKKYLDTETYTVLHDVTLPIRGGTTQIDHIVVSPFGIFVIETKNMSGWIFGGHKDRQWTQTFHRKKFRFQNHFDKTSSTSKQSLKSPGYPKTNFARWSLRSLRWLCQSDRVHRGPGRHR